MLSSLKKSILKATKLITISAVFLTSCTASTLREDDNLSHILSHISPEKPCDADSVGICEILPKDDSDWEPYLKKLQQMDDYSNEFIVQYEPPIIRVYALNPSSSSFICCDIQSPLRIIKRPDIGSFHFAQFRLPIDSFFEISLLGQKSFIGDKFIFNELDQYQSIYSNLPDDIDQDNIKNFSSDNFDRDIYIYRVYPDRSPDHIIYAKDGSDIYPYVRSLIAFFKSKKTPIPNIALVGFESGDSDIRLLEYMKTNSIVDSDGSLYDAYVSNFRLKLVPEIEAYLGYDKGASGRILTGKSAGGAWVVSFATEYPEFAKTVWSFSPAGTPSEVINRSNPHSLNSIHFTFGAGKYEEAFAADTKIYAQEIEALGSTVDIRFENSAHNFTSWVPLFLRAFEKRITTDSTTIN